MSRHIVYAFITLSIIVFGSIGCSQDISPLSPSTNYPTDLTAGGNRTAASDTSLRTTWGLWQVSIEASTGNYEIIPLRTAMGHLNCVPFLQKNGHTTMKLQELVIDGAKVDVNVGFTHPFPGLNQWSGFDVRGIFISDGTDSNWVSDNNIRVSNTTQPRLLNADGWTRWWNPEEFPSNGTILGYVDGVAGGSDSKFNFRNTLNPFKYFCDDLDLNGVFPTDMDFDRRGFFQASSAINWRHYSIDFGAQANWYKFNYAVDASHAFGPGGNGNVNPPSNEVPDPFFPISANMPEAFAVVPYAGINTLYYANATQFGGDLQLRIKIYDWQGMHSPAGIPGEIQQVLVESPTLLDTNIVTAALVPGSDPNFSTYGVDLIGCTPDGNFGQDILITVISTNGDYHIGYDGYPTTFNGDAEHIAAYMFFTPPVSTEVPPQTNYIKVNYPNGGETLNAGTNYNITWSYSSDILNVNLLFSKNGNAGPFNPIPGAQNIPCTGSFGWIPGNPDATTNGRIRVEDATETSVFDISDNNFTVAATIVDSITVISPNGGEIWKSGAIKTIHWTTTGTINSVKIEYSTNNGVQWHSIIGAVPNTGSYNWDTSAYDPLLASKQMLIRVSDALDGVPFDVSDATFSMDYLTVTVPNGPSDIFYVGQPKNITWTTGSGFAPGGVIQNVSIELSTTSSTGPFDVTLAVSTPNTGSWQWTPISSHKTETGWIRISNVDYTIINDINNAAFPVRDPIQELTLTEYRSFFQGGPYTYRGRRTNCSTANSLLNSSTTSWDFTTGTLDTLISSTTFTATCYAGSSIPHGPGDGGAPDFVAGDFGIRTNVSWPSPGGSITLTPTWVYNFDMTNNKLRVAGFSGYFDGVFLFGSWYLLANATHQFTPYTSGELISFPLNATSGPQNLSGLGTLYYGVSGPFSIQYQSTGPTFQVVSSGSVKVPQGNITYPNCLLIKNNSAIVEAQSGGIGVTGMLMWQWVNMDDGKILAFIWTHNDMQTTRFTANTGAVTGEAVIGVLN